MEIFEFIFIWLSCIASLCFVYQSWKNQVIKATYYLAIAILFISVSTYIRLYKNGYKIDKIKMQTEYLINTKKMKGNL